MLKRLFSMSAILVLALVIVGCNPDSGSNTDDNGDTGNGNNSGGTTVVTDAESNNTFETAQVVSEYVESIVGHVGEGEDFQDVYEITYTGTDLPRVNAQIDVNFDAVQGEAVIELANKYNYSMVEGYAYQDELGWVNDLITANTYYLYVYSDEPASYEIVFDVWTGKENTVDTLASGLSIYTENPDSNNNDESVADVVVPNIRINGSLGSYVDNGFDDISIDFRDCYSFVNDTDDREYTIKLDSEGLNDFDLYLIDDFDGEIDWSENTSSEESIVSTLASGTYYVCVYEYAGKGNYGLDITF